MSVEEIDILAVRQYFPSVVNPTSSYWVYEQLKEIQKKGLKTLVISPTPYIPSFIKKNTLKKYPSPDNTIKYYEGIKVIRPGYFRIPKSYFYKISNHFLEKSILQIGKKVNCKVIHAHFGNDGIASILLKKYLGLPLIVSFYGYDISDNLEVFKPYYNKLQKSGDLFLALSADMKNDLIDIGFPEERIIIHRLGIQFKELNSFQFKKKRNNNFTFVSVARFSERKGLHYVILAFQKILAQYPNSRLRLIGDGSYKSELLKLILNMKLTDKIKIINNFESTDPRKTVLTEIANSDVFILTSFTTKDGSKEGTPVVLMEAQALGKPCISTYHAGIPDIVLDNKTGLLCVEKNIDEIRVAMLKMIENKKMVLDYGNAGREHVKNEFNNELQIEKLYNIYKPLLK